MGLVAVFGFSVGLLGAALPPAREVVIDRWRAPAALTAGSWAATLGTTQRVHLVVFQNAESAWPTTVAPFRQASAWRDGPDLAALTRRCRQGGRRVSWVIDLLQWQAADLPPRGLAELVPAWLERTAAGSCNAGLEQGVYASPHHPAVERCLTDLARELLQQPELPDSLTLRCRQSSVSQLGFSEVARLASIDTLGFDPFDLEDESLWREWGTWREATVAGLLQRCLAPWRETLPTRPCIGWASAAFFIQSPRLRARAADNWLQWYHDRLVSEVILDGSWDDNALRLVWRNLDRVAASDPAMHDLRTSTAALVTSRDPGGRAATHPQWQALAAYGGPLERVVYYPVTDQDCGATAPGMP